MALQPEALLAHDFGSTIQSYTERDAILYALGVGLGSDPGDTDDLAYLFEDGLKVLPSFAVTLGSPGMWIRDPKFGVSFGQLVHFGQDTQFHRPLPKAGTAVATAHVHSLADRGSNRGAVLVLERQIGDDAGGRFATVRQTLLLRGDGGFGGPEPVREGSNIPDQPADFTAAFATSQRAALIYRLSGDWNPLHADPSTARAAGFERPIMQGLGTYGTALAAVSRAAGIDPQRVARLKCRFSGVLYPGETLDFAIWKIAEGLAFRATANGRKVLDDGFLQCGG